MSVHNNHGKIEITLRIKDRDKDHIEFSREINRDRFINLMNAGDGLNLLVLELNKLVYGAAGVIEVLELERESNGQPSMFQLGQPL